MKPKSKGTENPFKYALLIAKDKLALTVFNGENSCTLRMDRAVARRLGKMLVNRSVR